MFSLIKQVFILLLSFSSFLVRDRTKFVSLNHELYVIRPTLINLNPVDLKYYPFMISLDNVVEFLISSHKNMCSKRNKIHKY